MGSIQNRLKLQEDYACYFIVADLHTLTTRPGKEHIAKIKQNTRGMVLDWMACGLDPNKSIFFVQSRVPATFELNLYFEMLASVPRLSRLPTLKDMARDANIDEDAFSLGLFV